MDNKSLLGVFPINKKIRWNAYLGKSPGRFKKKEKFYQPLGGVPWVVTHDHLNPGCSNSSGGPYQSDDGTVRETIPSLKVHQCNQTVNLLARLKGLSCHRNSTTEGDFSNKEEIFTEARTKSTRPELTAKTGSFIYCVPNYKTTQENIPPNQWDFLHIDNISCTYQPGRWHRNIPADQMQHISPRWWWEERREPCCSPGCDQ